MQFEIDELVELLEGSVTEQHAVAAEALARLGSDAAPAAAALVRVCGSDDEAVREWAAAALEELGPPPSEQIQEIAALAASNSPGVAYWAATLLGRAGTAAQSAVGILTKALTSGADGSVRERAAWALGKIGPGAKPALPALRDAAASEEPRLARLAADAVQAIGG